MKTLFQNLQICTHIHGHDTIFDVELCLARIANMLNITCTDQVNVRTILPFSKVIEQSRAVEH